MSWFTATTTLPQVIGPHVVSTCPAPTAATAVRNRKSTPSPARWRTIASAAVRGSVCRSLSMCAPPTRRSRVDFPEPERPRSTTISPRDTSREDPLSAAVVPKVFVTPSRRMRASDAEAVMS